MNNIYTILKNEFNKSIEFKLYFIISLFLFYVIIFIDMDVCVKVFNISASSLIMILITIRIARKITEELDRLKEIIEDKPLTKIEFQTYANIFMFHINANMRVEECMLDYIGDPVNSLNKKYKYEDGPWFRSKNSAIKHLIKILKDTNLEESKE